MRESTGSVVTVSWIDKQTEERQFGSPTEMAMWYAARVLFETGEDVGDESVSEMMPHAAAYLICEGWFTYDEYMESWIAEQMKLMEQELGP